MNFFKLSLVSLCFYAHTAYSQSVETLRIYCDKTDSIIQKLTNEFKETPFILGSGESENGGFMTMWKNDDTSTWTIVYTKQELSCIIGSGKKLIFKFQN